MSWLPSVRMGRILWQNIYSFAAQKGKPCGMSGNGIDYGVCKSGLKCELPNKLGKGSGGNKICVKDKGMDSRYSHIALRSRFGICLNKKILRNLKETKTTFLVLFLEKYFLRFGKIMEWKNRDLKYALKWIMKKK